MGVTAHWIQAITTEDGTQELKLRSDLVGFYKIPGHHTGHHTGHHLAICFIYITDHLKITEKVFFLKKKSYPLKLYLT